MCPQAGQGERQVEKVDTVNVWLRILYVQVYVCGHVAHHLDLLSLLVRMQLQTIDVEVNTSKIVRDCNCRYIESNRKHHSVQ